MRIARLNAQSLIAEGEGCQPQAVSQTSPARPLASRWAEASGKQAPTTIRRLSPPEKIAARSCLSIARRRKNPVLSTGV